ncbi:MAG: DUF4249 domain-containing protein [Cyclobacteriaceae bacterium]|nr:DUF4249 domain-containing protein [Cyclobacteriaceae bacterium]
MSRRFLFWILVIFSACVDPLQIPIPDEDRRIVVDGLITNQPGPYQVKLFYTNRISTSRLQPFEPVSGAVVSIKSDFGQIYTLTEVKAGLYESDPDELTGEIGRSYQVVIQTPDEKVYESALQQLTNPGEITDVDFVFAPASLPGFSGTILDGLEIFIDSKGFSSGNNLFRWRWKTIHKVRAYPELEVILTPSGPIPNPEPCSGHVRRGMGTEQIGECTCCYCWSYDYSEQARVSKNRFVSANTFLNESIGLIPVTSMHFFDKYHLEVQQLSLSEEAYYFWDLVEKQQNGNADIFQPNAIKIRGNIYRVDDPDEEALGFFGVSGVASRSLYIDQNEVPYTFGDIEIVPYSCLSYFKNSTNQQPVFW